MSLVRAGGLATLIMSVLATATLIVFEDWYVSFSTGDIIKRALLWFPASLFATAPVTLVLFPLVHAFSARVLAVRPTGRLFALIGGVCGAAIAAFVLFRFRAAITTDIRITFLVLSMSVISATVIGIVGGFLFERLARRSAPLGVRSLDPPAPNGPGA